MKKRGVLLLVVVLLTAFSAASQEDDTRGTAFYIELLGKGFFSANLDFPLGGNDRLTVGLTALDHEFPKKEGEEELPTLTLPTPSVMYFHLFGQEKHYFETGFGVSISPVFWKQYSENDSALSLHGSLGYRYQQKDKFFFRAGFTPFYRVKWAFLPLVGVSAGFSL